MISSKIPKSLRLMKTIRGVFMGKQSISDLQEAMYAEDDDEIIIQEEIPEECPTCNSHEELRNLIEKMNVSRKISWLVVHCTATPKKTSVSSILNYWKNNLGWNNPGYHLIFLPDGSWTLIAEFDIIANGVKGYNFIGLQFSYIGGVDNSGKPVDNLTPEAKKTMEVAIESTLKRWPHLKTNFQGHRDFPNVAKACPCFDTKSKFSLLLK